MNMQKMAALGASLLVGSVLCIGEASATTVTISCSATGHDLEQCTQGAQAWAKKTGNEVKVVSMPATGQLALYQQLLSAGSSDIDVLQIDVVWPGILAQDLVDLTKYAGNSTAGDFPVYVKNDTVGGKLVAMPWFADAGVMYYRKDLLDKYHVDVPKTWEELTADAKKIQDAERAAGNSKMWGFVWQGKNYEGLTCDALEWVQSYNGGSIVDGSGKVTIDNPAAVNALKMAHGWIGTISPEGVLNYQEEEARGVFQSGDAVFMRNWPYAWSLANSADSPIKGKVGITTLPAGGANGRHAAVLGGWQLAVSKYSKNPDAAASLVMYLTSEQEQKRRAIEGGYASTIEALYKDKDVRDAIGPFADSLHDNLVNAVARPSSITKTRYNQVSTEFSGAAYAALSGSVDPAASLKDLDDKLHGLSHGGKW
ncbi:putative ABC transporter-binding protein DR_1438 [Pararobbsia alpina]|uniref:ABC transporter substrate-binding protein n=1 Tax=Pararobbsia alpina TaxID=621374 RepID=UPI0039A687A8